MASPSVTLEALNAFLVEHQGGEVEHGAGSDGADQAQAGHFAQGRGKLEPPGQPP
jgi:hypothetical protein